MKAKFFLAFTFLLTILIRTFALDYFLIPTYSMNPSIDAGENILVSKLDCGPRWPTQPLEISYFNLLAFIPPLTDWFVNTEWPYRRWPELGQLERNDIVVFDAPFKFKDKLVKRCIGLPGDTIAVVQHQAYVNHQVWKEAVSVRPNPTTFASTAPDPLANHGPLVVPYQGQSIALDTANLRYYQKTIKREGHDVERRGDTILIDGQASTAYTFQHDYYFMLGDNRAFSHDSRKWGLVPEENIIGKAVLVLWSREPQSGNIRWSRLFNSIN